MYYYLTVDERLRTLNVGGSCKYGPTDAKV